MSVNYKTLIGRLFLNFLFVLIGSGQAQGQTVAEPDFGDGALEEASVKMKMLLQLKWNGDNLGLKREWDERVKKKNRNAGKEDELDEITGQLIERTLPPRTVKQLADLVDRGLPPEEAQRLVDAAERGARQMAEKMVEDGNPAEALRRLDKKMNRFGVEKHFFAISSLIGASTGRSGGGNERRLHFFNQSLLGEAVLQNGSMKFEFAEKTGNERSFKVWDNSEGQFKFEFTFDDLFVRLMQSKSGKTQLIWIEDDKVDVYVGDSFSNFMKRNPLVAEKMLFPLFKQLGIKLPTSVPDP